MIALDSLDITWTAKITMMEHPAPLRNLENLKWDKMKNLDLKWKEAKAKWLV